MAIKNTEDVSSRPLTPAIEDYLEAIFDLDREKKVVRVRDIAKKLGVKMPTVTSMLKSLRDRNLVTYQKYEYVELTREGESIGREINRRHHILRRFLTEILKVKPGQADKEACKMEHAVSQTTLDKLVNFMGFIQACPRTGAEWLERFDEFCVHGLSPEKCQTEACTFTEGLGLRTGQSEEPGESENDSEKL